MKVLRGDFGLGDWHVSPSRNSMACGARRVKVKHKSMAVLQCLAKAGGEVVPRNEILDTVWPGMDVSDDVVTQSVVELRKAFDDDVKAPRFIETVPRMGFRLATEPRPVASAGAREVRWALIAAGAAVLVIAVSLFVGYGPADRQRAIELPELRSVAVLPFENLSPDPENDYLADGLTEEIRSLLAQVDGLRVIGRSSSRAAAEADHDAMSVGDRLRVATVLEGTVRHNQDRLRVSLHMIDTGDGTAIWSGTYERIVGDVFTLQDEIAAAVVDGLRLHVSAVPTRNVPTTSPQAYDLYLRAKSATHKFAWFEAEELLRSAINLDPAFAEAFELLAFVYYSAAGSIYSATESQVLVGEAARRAVELNPELVYAPVMAAATSMGADYRRGSLAAVQAALDSHPHEPTLLELYTWLLTEMGYLDEAMGSAQRYLAVDPLAQQANSHMATALYALGKVDDALAVDLLAKGGGKQLNIWTWTFFGMLVAERRDDEAAAALQAWLDERDFPERNLAAQLIREARSRTGGIAALDAAVVKLLQHLEADRSFDWSEEVLSLYLYFGYLDRYFELLMATGPSDQTWHYAGIHAWRGTVFRRSGYTAHPGFRELARLLSIDDVWDDRGAPDFCSLENGDWTCR